MTTGQPPRLARLADIAFRRRRLVLGAWIAALIAMFALSSQLKGAWSADYSTPGSESKAAATLLADRFPARSPDTIDVVWQDRAGAMSRATVAKVAPLLAAGQRRDGAPGPGLARRRHRRRPPPAHRARGRCPEGDRQEADRARVGCVARRRARRAGRAGHPERPAGRDLLGGHRHHDCRLRAAAHLRLADRRRPPVADGGLRAGHLGRARRPARGGDECPRLGAAGRGHDRDRRRDRLRAPHPDPVSRGAFGGP